MVRCPSQPRSAAPSLGGGTTRLAPLDLPACPCHTRCRFPSPPLESGQAAVLSGVVGQGVLFPKDETHFRCIHHATSQSSLPSWLHTFTSAGLSGRCCSPEAQRRAWLTPNDSPGPWYTRRDYRSNWTLRPFHRTVFTAHTWVSLFEILLNRYRHATFVRGLFFYSLRLEKAK